MGRHRERLKRRHNGRGGRGMKKQKYECKYGPTSSRKCLVPFNGNGRHICRLYELGQCGFDLDGNKINAARAVIKEARDDAE